MQTLSPAGQAILETMVNYHAERLSAFERGQALERARRDRKLPASLSRAVAQMAVESGLAGAEREWAQETARLWPVINNYPAAGYDAHRIYVPWSACTRDLNVAADSAGGYLVGTDIMATQDILRPWSVVARSGITVESGLVGDNVLPVTASTTTVSWMSSETAAATPVDPTISATTMQPRVAIGVMQASRHFMKQARDPERYIRRELLNTAGTIVDTAVLNGSGASGQPRGVLNITGLSTQAGGTLARAGVLTMKSNALTADAPEESISFITTPAVQVLLEGRETVATSGIYLWQDGKMVNCPAFASTTMPAATMLSGPMVHVFLGLWGAGFVIEINPYDPTLFKSGIIQARVIVACDVALGCAAAAFTKATSVS